MPGAAFAVVVAQARTDTANVPDWLEKAMRDEGDDSARSSYDDPAQSPHDDHAPEPQAQVLERLAPQQSSGENFYGRGPVFTYFDLPPPRFAPKAPETTGIPEPPAQESAKLSENGGFDIHLSVGYASVPLGKATFEGSGVPVGGSDRKNFIATGDALGLHSPPFVIGELGASYVRRFLSIGFIVGGGGAPRGAQQAPLDPTLAAQLDPGRMIMLEGAADLAAVVSHDPAIVRLGAVVGARHVGAPLLGFENETCTSRRLPCAPGASTTVALLQPRASLDFAVGHGAHVVALGAYVGVDAYPEAAWSFGLSVSFLTPPWRLAP